VITRDGLNMDQEKVKAIINWPNRRSILEVRSFHGLTSFYRKFIKQLVEDALQWWRQLKETNNHLSGQKQLIRVLDY
jgi:hypothetical protein